MLLCWLYFPKHASSMRGSYINMKRNWFIASPLPRLARSVWDNPLAVLAPYPRPSHAKSTFLSKMLTPLMPNQHFGRIYMDFWYLGWTCQDLEDLGGVGIKISLKVTKNIKIHTFFWGVVVFVGENRRRPPSSEASYLLARQAKLRDKPGQAKARQAKQAKPRQA